MQRWTLLDTADIPGGEGRMRLLQRGSEFSIKVDNLDLMNSRVRGSEEALARLGCAKIDKLAKSHVLIGGLGMGFTLRAALDLLGPEAQVVVAELVPAIVSWCRGPLAVLSGNPLADTRVKIHDGDIGQLIRTERSSYDAILLDVDNGPDGLTRRANGSLYDPDGLRAFRNALRPGGVLAVWSAGPDPSFTRRLRKTGFSVDEGPVRANGKRGSRQMIWVAAKY